MGAAGTLDLGLCYYIKLAAAEPKKMDPKNIALTEIMIVSL